MKDDPYLAIGEVSRRSGFATSAVRFYDSQGLITSERSSGGHRVFRRSVLRRLAFIRAAQNVGLSLREVEEALSTLPASRTPTKADWERLTRFWRHRIDEQIGALEALRDQLSSCIGCGCLSLQRCALSNPGDVAGTRTTGAAFLPQRLREGSATPAG